MSHSQSTPNYQLPIFVNNDQPTWLGDVNSAMRAIDTGIHTAKTAGDTNTVAITNLQSTVSEHTADITNLQSTVSDHTASIAELHDGVDTLESEFANIGNATAEKAGLVKISDSTSGNDSATAISQKGAANLPRMEKLWAGSIGSGNIPITNRGAYACFALVTENNRVIWVHNAIGATNCGTAYSESPDSNYQLSVRSVELTISDSGINITKTDDMLLQATTLGGSVTFTGFNRDIKIAAVYGLRGTI